MCDFDYSDCCCFDTDLWAKNPVYDSDPELELSPPSDDSAPRRFTGRGIVSPEEGSGEDASDNGKMIDRLKPLL